MSKRYPGRHLSIPRVVVAVLVALSLCVAGTYWIQRSRYASKSLPAPWFAGYVDVTATPSYTFESDVGSQYMNVVLGFVVAGKDGCSPSWGGYYTPSQAASQLDLDSRVAQVESSDRTVTISFGGQKGSELAQECSSSGSLYRQYASVINRYHVNSVDFDIEGSALGNSSANKRRAEAVARLVSERKADGGSLTVSLTVPVGRDGITSDTLSVIDLFLDAGVRIDNLNLMTMDYGVASSQTAQSDIIIDSLKAVHAQYRRILYSHGLFYDSDQVWKLMGATVLNGQNDTSNEFRTLDDAQKVNTFALSTSLGRLSMWSLNRDYQCGSNVDTDADVVSFCSGVKQTDGEYAQVLAQGLTGIPGTLVDYSAAWKDTDSTVSYSKWDTSRRYVKGNKVVSDGNIYEATSPNVGVSPSSDQTDDEESPWRLIGPAV